MGEVSDWTSTMSAQSSCSMLGEATTVPKWNSATANFEAGLEGRKKMIVLLSYLARKMGHYT